MLTARAENHIRGNPDLADTVARLHAYEQAGADVLYAPGLRSAERDPAGVRGSDQAGERAGRAGAVASPTSLAAGARRVSVGGALTWVAARAMADAAVAIRDHGDFSALAARLPLGDWLAPGPAAPAS